MNIACDARALVGPQTGVGTWTTQVMGGLGRYPEHHILLAASKPINLEEPLLQPRVTAMAPPRLPWPGTLWLHSVLPAHLARSHADVFIGALGVLPRRCPAPGILVVHDITPRSHPHHHTLANRFCFNAYLEESLDTAASVVAVSRATATTLLEVFPWIKTRLVVIPNGVDPFFCPAQPTDDGEETRRTFANGHRYLLHLGTLEPRKGLLTLIEAWERIRLEVEAPLDLVLAGGEGWDAGPLNRRLASSRWRSDIHLPGYVSREQARSLMRHASAFVLASEAEGFGLPLAEAIACGTPCVASDILSLRETGGEAALYSPPGQPQELCETIARALQSEVAAQLRAATAQQAKKLQWDWVIRRWNDLLTTVLPDS